MTVAVDAVRDDPARSFIGVLGRLDQSAGEDGLTVGGIVDTLDERAFGLLTLLLTIPCLVPGLPGAQVIAIPIFLLAGQIVVGRREPWLPNWFLRLRVRKAWLSAIATFADKRLRWTERLSRPRLSFLARGAGERFAALFMLVAAVTIMLPLTNTIPSMALTFLSIALIQRDGFFALVGELIAAAWFAVLVALIVGLFAGAGFAVDFAAERAPWLLEWLRQ